MIIHAIYRPNVPAHARQLRLLTSARKFDALSRNLPAMMTEAIEASSIEEARERMNARFEDYDLEMRRLLAGY